MNYAQHPYGLTVKGAADQLCIGRTLLYDLIRQGKIKPVKLGRRTIIPANQVAELLACCATSKAERQ